MNKSTEKELLKKRISELEEDIKNLKKRNHLNQNELIYKNILEHSTNAFYSHTPKHEITYFSTQASNILGYTPEEMMIKWTELATDNPINEEGLRKTNLALETGVKQPPYELELLHKSGKKVYVEVHEAPVVENGKTIAIVGALTDLTDQKIAGSGLKESEEKFRLLFEKSRDPILIIDGYSFVECNKATIEILGYTSKEELFNIHPSKLSPEYQPDGKPSFEKAEEMMDIAYEKGYHRFEWIHSDKDGHNIFMDVALTKIPYKGKDMLFTAWRDISMQKEYEKTLIKSEKQYSTLFEQAADGILVGIKGGEIVEANQSILKLTGYEKKELVGKNIGLLFEKEELSNKPLRYDLIKKGVTVIRERNIIGKNGERIPIEMNTKILEDGRMQALFRDLTKRKEAEKEAEKNWGLLQKAEIIAGLGSYYYDVATDNWTSSEVLNEIYGIDNNYNKNFENWLGIIHPEFKTEMLKYFTINILKNHEPFNKEYKIKRISDGEERWVHGFGEIQFNASNEPVSIFGTIQDITQRKESEIALRESEEKYRNIFLNSPLGILHYDNKGNITDCNDHFVNIIGSNKESLIGLNMIKGLKNKKLIRAIKDSIKKGEGYYEDWYQSVTAEKNTYVRIILKSITDNNNKIIAGIGLVEDITDRKNAEEALKERTNFLDRILESSAISMWISDEKGTAIRTNPACLEFFGATEEEVIGKYNLFNDSVIEKAGLMPEVKTVFDHGEVANLIVDYNFGEVDHVSVKEATHKIINTILTPVLDGNGKTTNVIVQAIDLTDIKSAELEIKKSEEKFRLLFENSQDGIFIADEKEIIDCNSQAVKIFACKSKEELKIRFLKDFSPEFQPDGTRSVEKAKEKVSLAQKGEKIIFEWLHSKKDGTMFYAEVSHIPFTIEGKQYVQSIVRDITERKEIDQKIFDTIVETEEKERQRLASDIHDEIGPLLSSLKMYIDSIDENNNEKLGFLKGKLNSLIKESIINVREVSNALSPYLLNKYGLSVAIKSFLDNSNNHIKANFRTNLTEERFPINIETVYFRILKELFNNTIKHANATQINISLNYIDNNIVLVYQDNGEGIDKRKLETLEKKGIGMFNITNRAMSIKGNYQFITNKKGFGFQLMKKINTN